MKFYQRLMLSLKENRMTSNKLLDELTRAFQRADGSLEQLCSDFREPIRKNLVMWHRQLKSFKWDRVTCVRYSMALGEVGKLIAHRGH